MEHRFKEEIDGVCLTPLNIISDKRGEVLHMLRSDSSYFNQFGEVYFSLVKSGVVKAWKCHRIMTQNIAVPQGLIKLAIFDERSNSPTFGVLSEIICGRPNHYSLVTIPPMLWYGFKAISTTDALLANCTDFAHDPSECDRRDTDNKFINYTWKNS